MTAGSGGSGRRGDAGYARPGRPVRHRARRASDRVLRVTAENLNRLLGLAGESLRRVALGQAVRRIAAAAEAAAARFGHDARDSARRAAGAARRTSQRTRRSPSAQRRRHRVTSSSWRSGWPSSRCSTAARSIWRIGSTTKRWPAACGRSPTASRAFRAWCATSRASLGKQVKLEIVGEATQVDRDILAKLDAPLGHLLRNAVDHGVESPDERARGRQTRRGRRAARGASQRRRAAHHRVRRRPRRRPRASCATPSSRGT